MAYTVNEAYTLVLQEADKMGSDYFTLDAVLKRFRTCAYDFVGSKAAEIERTQQVTDDIRPLVKMAPIAATPSVVEAQVYNAAMPSDYHTRLSIIVEYNTGSRSVKPKIERIGEHNTNMADPFNNAHPDYPLIKQMSDFFEIYPGGPVATQIFLTYLKKPTFGVNLGDLIINLPIAATEEILKQTAASLTLTTGDQRAASEYQVNATSRKAGK